MSQHRPDIPTELLCPSNPSVAYALDEECRLLRLIRHQPSTRRTSAIRHSPLRTGWIAFHLRRPPLNQVISIASRCIE
jgi:hypothetical protein